MINWKPASEPPSDGRSVWFTDTMGVSIFKARFNPNLELAYITVESGVDAPFEAWQDCSFMYGYWCELSELNLPTGDNA